MTSPTADDNEVLSILIKGWETIQSLAKSNADAAWNLRAWGISVWSALVAYAYTSQKHEVIFVALMTLIAVFFVELAVRQIQYKYIEKSIQIENSINAILLGELPQIPAGGISTNIETPNIVDLIKLLSLKRWLIWFPYLLLSGFSWIAIQTINTN